MKKHWYKILAVGLILYTLWFGLMGDVPRKVVLNESIRNLYFHVPMWFGMILILGASAYHSIRYLIKPDMLHDTKADSTAKVGVLFSLLGMATGMVWAQYTWGAWWSGDPKQNTSAIAILIYLAYLVLRGSFNEEQQRARISAVYNIFAFACLVPLLFILPRLTDSLHPGNGGNPGFGAYDLDNRMRMVFYPAVIGWTLLGFWIASLRTRILTLEQKEHE
ncbi:MAG: cytochrome c biogenesis protein CcsA [Sphingobacteriaceae bacterium]|nr:cytochrome c biogenesis protein CcsA [Sphingobacteriaceae bacterium]